MWERDCGAVTGDSARIVQPTGLSVSGLGLGTPCGSGPYRADFLICVLPDDSRRKHSLVLESNKLCKKSGNGKGRAISQQPWTGPEGSRRLRLSDFKTVGTLRW